MSHTPGPWEVRDIGYGAHVGEVAWVGFGSRCSKEEHMANARLMAAAPELLESLTSLMNEVDTHFNSSGSGKMHQNLKDAFYNAIDLCSAMRTESNKGENGKVV